MHTDPTLDIFDNITVQIGARFRSFSNTTCSAFKTKELRREMEARKRGKSKGEKKAHDPIVLGLSADPVIELDSQMENRDDGQEVIEVTESRAEKRADGKEVTEVTESREKQADGKEANGRRPKKFKLQSYKYHSLGDYPKMIRRYDTTDSYSTEAVSAIISHRWWLTMMLPSSVG